MSQLRKTRRILPRRQMHKALDHHEDPLGRRLLPPPRQKPVPTTSKPCPRERSVPTINGATSRALDTGEPEENLPVGSAMGNLMPVARYCNRWVSLTSLPFSAP